MDLLADIAEAALTWLEDQSAARKFAFACSLAVVTLCAIAAIVLWFRWH